LPPAFGAVDDETWFRSGSGWTLGKASGIPLGTNAEIVQSPLEDRQQPMNPRVHPRLTQPKEFAHDSLKGIGLEVDQDKQEFVFWPMQAPLATTTRGALSGLPLDGSARGIESLISPREGTQQKLKLRQPQASEGQKLAAVGLESLVCDHTSTILLIPDNV
jgi:hypothetical protein